MERRRWKYSRSLGLAVVATCALAACDTGDGTTLQAPTAGTTLPPPDTTPLESVAIDDAGGDDVAVVPPADDLDLDEIAVPDSSGPGFQALLPWTEDAMIDPAYTCDGSNTAPAVAWTGVPEGTVEIAVAFVNESTLNNGQPFIHWVIAGLDPLADRIGEGQVPPGALQGINFFGEVGYTGPCPDPGTTNNYRVTIYALGQQLEAVDGTPGAEMLDLIDTVAIATASMTGTAMR